MKITVNAQILTRLGPRGCVAGLGAVSAAVLAGAYGFEHLGGFLPCQMCLWQRWPHGLAVVVAVVAVLLAGRVPAAAVLGLGAVFLLAAGGAGLAAYHVGMEQHWWPGPASCAAGGGFDPALSLQELRAALLETPFVPCDRVAWSLGGVSMAGYNALVSAGQAGLALVVLTARAGAAGSGRPSHAR